MHQAEPAGLDPVLGATSVLPLHDMSEAALAAFYSISQGGSRSEAPHESSESRSASPSFSSVGDAAALGAAVEGRPAPQPARARLDKDFTCRSARAGA